MSWPCRSEQRRSHFATYLIPTRACLSHPPTTHPPTDPPTHLPTHLQEVVSIYHLLLTTTHYSLLTAYYLLWQEVVSTWLQCDHPTCLKWRIVPDLLGVVPEDDEPWYCELNRDPARNTCEAPQQPDDATLDEAVLALLAEADPDRDPDEDGDEPITDGLPPTPPLPSTAPADAPASAAAAAAAPPSASEEPAAPSASPPAAAPSGRRSSGRAKAEEPAPAPTSPPEPPTKAGQKGTKGTKGTKDKEEAALAQPKPPKPKPKPKAVAAPVLMARVEVALGEADMASWYQARDHVSVVSSR